GQRREELPHGGLPGVLVVLLGRAVRAGHALLPARRARAVAVAKARAQSQTAEQGRRPERGDARIMTEANPAAAPRSSAMGHAMLWLDDISVSFDGFKALDGLNLVLDTGELRCIIGPNGAGKTTMMDVITGKTRPDRGRVFMDGSRVELTRLSEYQIARHGIGRKFQRPTV